MDVRFGLSSFRVFRELYECAIDDLLAVHGGEFSFRELQWEKSPLNRENNDLVLLLTYRGESVLAWELKDASAEYQWRRRSRLN